MADSDLLTLAEARDAVNLTGNDHDTELAVYVTAVSQRIDSLCGPVVNRTVTDELHDGGRARIFPRYTPVSSVTSITEYVSTTGTALTAETNATKPASGYLLDHTGTLSYIWRRSGGADRAFADGRRNVSITYVAGRYASTATVEERFKTAAAGVLRRIWKREQSAWAQAANFFPDTENPAPSLRFFKAVDPIIAELLSDQLLTVAVA